MDKLRRITTSVGCKTELIVTPLVPDTKMLVRLPSPFKVMDLVMVTAPKPPGSSAEISPPAAVFEIAPANVLQGAVRLQGLASSPTPEIQVRVACAFASEDIPQDST